jgi:hypothetical protein
MLALCLREAASLPRLFYTLRFSIDVGVCVFFFFAPPWGMGFSVGKSFNIIKGECIYY